MLVKALAWGPLLYHTSALGATCNGTRSTSALRHILSRTWISNSDPRAVVTVFSNPLSCIPQPLPDLEKLDRSSYTHNPEFHQVYLTNWTSENRQTSFFADCWFFCLLTSLSSRNLLRFLQINIIRRMGYTASIYSENYEGPSPREGGEIWVFKHLPRFQTQQQG